MTQFSLFGAAAAPPALDDLDGVLLAGGHWVHTGSQARLSVVVAQRWRATALVEAFATLGLACPDAIVDAEAGLGARTSFAAGLLDLAARWRRGAVEGPPSGFALSPGGLRLWAIAAGRAEEFGYLLATAHPDGPVHMAGGAQLARFGVAAASIGPRGGPGWRITSAKRLRRLAELLGEAPAGAGHDWPTPR